jgi:small conductance mechanosensitive channel
MENINEFGTYLMDLVKLHGPQFALAIFTLIVGLWVIKMLTRVIGKSMEARNVDESLKGFFKSFFSIALKVLLVVTVIGMLGIEATSFVAILGAAGLAVGLALSGMLQNFAGGVMILILKPFKVGDYITAQGQSGTVSQILIFNTILKTPDNKTIIIPNGGLSTSTMINFSTEETRRVDLLFGVSYEDDIDKAREIILGVLNANNKIQQDPKPFIGVVELADSSVNFAVRAWVSAVDYWDVFFYMQETVKKAFDKAGITIPFPQQEMRVIETKK